MQEGVYELVDLYSTTCHPNTLYWLFTGRPQLHIPHVHMSTCFRKEPRPQWSSQLQQDGPAGPALGVLLVLAALILRLSSLEVSIHNTLKTSRDRKTLPRVDLIDWQGVEFFLPNNKFCQILNCQNLSCLNLSLILLQYELWILSQFKIWLYDTIRVEFDCCLSFKFCHNLVFWALSQFELLEYLICHIFSFSFVTIWVLDLFQFEFLSCHSLSFWVVKTWVL